MVAAPLRAGCALANPEDIALREQPPSRAVDALIATEQWCKAPSSGAVANVSTNVSIASSMEWTGAGRNCAVSSPRPSAVGSMTVASAAGTVVRTKYTPLDEDSDTDSESDLVLMKRYGITGH